MTTALATHLLLIGAYALVTIGLVMAIIRLFRGPGLPDRIVALELIASLTIGLILVNAVENNVRAVLDVAMVLALTGFLASVAFARYIDRNQRRQSRSDDHG